MPAMVQVCSLEFAPLAAGCVDEVVLASGLEERQWKCEERWLAASILVLRAAC
jgi:hypothetical protein